MSDAAAEPTIKDRLDELKKSNDERARMFAAQGAVMDLTNVLVEWIVDGFVDGENRDEALLTWQIKRAGILDLADSRLARQKLLQR